MERDVKKKKLDFKCNECKKRYSLKELDNLGFIENIAGLTTVECPNCGCQDTYSR